MICRHRRFLYKTVCDSQRGSSKILNACAGGKIFCCGPYILWPTSSGRSVSHSRSPGPPLGSGSVLPCSRSPPPSSGWSLLLRSSFYSRRGRMASAAIAASPTRPHDAPPPLPYECMSSGSLVRRWLGPAWPAAAGPRLPRCAPTARLLPLLGLLLRLVLTLISLSTPPPIAL